MYLVVSEWEAYPGKEEEFENGGRIMRPLLLRQPGVVTVEAFKSGSKLIVVHGYQDEAAYRAVVHDPDGEFAKAAVANHLEESARWLRSESGETLPF